MCTGKMDAKVYVYIRGKYEKCSSEHSTHQITILFNPDIFPSQQSLLGRHCALYNGVMRLIF